MGGYNDYSMVPPESEDAAVGICHARGENAGQPPQWMIYITVADLAACVAKCRAMGGEVVAGPRYVGNDQFCVIKDPAGAVCGLYEAAHSE